MIKFGKDLDSIFYTKTMNYQKSTPGGGPLFMFSRVLVVFDGL